jgi:hypothetical protein
MNSIQKLRSTKGNYRKLLQNAGYTSIKAFRRDNPEYHNDGEAYSSLLGIYNSNVAYILEQQRLDRERIRLQQQAIRQQERLQQRQRKQMSKDEIKRISKALATPSGFGKIRSSVPINLNALNGNISGLLDAVLKMTKRTYLQSGNKFYTLNASTIRSLKELLQNHHLEGEEYESGQELLTLIMNTGDIRIGYLEDRILTKIEGGLFPYTHTLDIDLSKYGIYKYTDNWGELNNSNNCFILALKGLGINLDKVKQYIQNQYLPVCKLKQVALLLNLYFKVRRVKTDNSSRVQEFGNPEHPLVELGLLDKHYFIIEPTKYTSYAIKNYFQIKELPNWETIANFHQQDNCYKRDATITIDSYKLISLLLKNKETHLRELSGAEIYNLSNWKEKEETIFECLEYDDSEYHEKQNPNGEVRLQTPKENFKYYEDIVFFDFETTTRRNDKVKTIHKPYCCFTDKEKTGYYGLNCGRYMLDDILEKYGESKQVIELQRKIALKNKEFPLPDYPLVLLIAHNATYDFRFIEQYLHQLTTIEKGNGLMSANGYYEATLSRGKRKGKKCSVKIEIRCSLKMINMPLKKFGKSFNLQVKKEIMPYDLYTEENIQREFIPTKEFLSYIPEQDHKEVIENIRKWDCFTDKRKEVNIIRYAGEYCYMDCIVLRDGYTKFRQLTIEALELDPINYISLASMADDYLKTQGCYDDVYQLCGVPRAFIQKCIVGGRCMIANNEKLYILNKISNDFDATSLYPTGMERMDGFLIGKPKVITTFIPDLYTSYFICIRITKVGRKLRFPLISIKTDSGIRNFTNDLEGQIIYIDKTGLEDAIKYQQIEYEFINGYYYNEGYNPNIKETMSFLFTQRLKYKKEENPLQLIFKECMNSCYGKSYMKPIDKEIQYIYEKDFEKFMFREFNYIKEATLLGNGNRYKIIMMEKVRKHFNYAHIGVEILSITKRIMNEVMVLAEDLKIDLYYQDTDSIHIEDVNIQPLANAFKEKYGRELIGKNMGQFHSDFELEYEKDKKCKNVVAIESIFLGKKCYCDKLRGVNDKGEYVYGFHIRMKGIPEDSILHKAEQEYNGDVMELYKALYNGEELEFDLLAKKPKFDLRSDMTIISKDEFVRKIKF